MSGLERFETFKAKREVRWMKTTLILCAAASILGFAHHDIIYFALLFANESWPNPCHSHHRLEF